MDPVQTLKTYISHTRHVHPMGRPVFISLCKPFKAVSSATIAKDLEAAISLARVGGKGFSAKSFRPRGGTAAIQAACNPDNVKSIRRWKSREVFEEHYIYPKVANTFTDSILQV